MAKYKIIPSSRTIEQSPISIGHKAEKGVEAIEFDLTAWVETYGSGTLTVIMRRWGDEIPYPIALEIDENNKATWTLSDIDTAKAGMAYAQLSYVVGDEVVKKSDIYTFRVMDSLTGEGEPPEAYESWLEHLTHLAAEAMAEALDIEDIPTDKTLTVDGGIADAKAAGDALSALEDQFTEETDQLKADLNATNGDINKLIGNIQGTWNLGGMYSATGIEYNSSNRIRTPFIKVNPGDTIQIANPDTTLELSVFEFASNAPTTTGTNERLQITYVGSSVKKVTLGNSTNYIRLQLPTEDTLKGDDLLLYTKNSVVFDSIAEVSEDLSETLGDLKADLGDKSHLETLDKTNIVSAINSLNGIVRIIANRDTSWAGIKENVKSGYGEILYPVGTDFSVSCPSGAPYNDIVFTVVNHRVENDEPIMTLLMKHVIYGIQFDAIQAMICPSKPMPAGTYHFKLLDGYDTAYDGGKYVQFTLANALEAGGQIVIDWPHDQTWIGKNATVYHAFGTTAVETCVMSEGTGGTYLGVADGTVSILNHTHRGRCGSNNYAESAVREWLNSDGAAGAWQTQKTKFQRPCNYNASNAGFVTYLDPEFVAIVRSGSHPNRTNQVFDLNGTKQAYSTTDKFYLLSNEEVGFTSESGIVCGTVLDFYKEAAQEDKIKYDITSQATAKYWWLRLPTPTFASIERFVTKSGAPSSDFAYYYYGAAAACEI